MPTLKAYNISHQFSNGELLFQQISCVMNKHRVGLVGRNGVGKTILASILSGETTPSSGAVTVPKSFAIYRQQPSELLSGECSIAQFLGKELVLNALKQIESGDCSTKWFDLVGSEWEVEARLKQQLAAMALPQNPNFPCSQLSGGQLARLQLWQLFEGDTELLILDEPSNHLDTHAKQWLIESIKNFNGSILLISHDRELLREMEEIWELSSLGLLVFGGNYDFYSHQKHIDLQAVERQLATVTKQKKQLEEQTQRNREKAQQRASQSNKLRRDGSQPKMLLDGKKESAEDRVSSRNKNDQLRKAHLQQKEQALKSRHEKMKHQKLYLADSSNRSRKVLSIHEGMLIFGCTVPITLQIFANDKVHLTGNNGGGKSTLLRTLLSDLPLLQGDLQVNTPLYYLDQHFGTIRHNLSMLDNLVQHCEGMKMHEARTLLAGIGFRRDSVFRLGEILSGGEKMKLAMLIVSHQPTKPLLLLDEPDNHLDLDSKIMLAQALNAYRGGFILVTHDQDFAAESGVCRQIELK